MPDTALTASPSLRRGDAAGAGAERIALVEAIAATGSISAAAKAVGLSYRAAWDAIQALNNLFDRPLVVAGPGGKGGGGARVTDEGRAVVRGFKRMEADLARALAALRAELGGEVPAGLMWSLSMRTSVRNALKGTVRQIRDGAVNAEVDVAVAPGVEVVAMVTRSSVADLGLAPGAPVIALINPSVIILAREAEMGRSSARNRLVGIVARREDGAVNSELTLDLGEGKTLAATITRDSAEELDFREGERLCALVKASHVILVAE
ncbi:MAG TPA: TOBE domain-containing protein [Caulobacteraceae bacterium]|nr:TOBE domain-containing protein [Caulobacteraceae bacterium]